MKIDKIYVISLDVSQTAIASIRERLEALGVSKTSFEIVPAHNGKEKPLPAGLRVNPNWALADTTNKWWSSPVTPGEIGCTVSHLDVWRRFLDSDKSTALILEEDFISVKKVGNLLETIPSDYNWELLYLGRNKVKDDIAEVGDSFVVPGYSYTSHAYVVTREGAHKLYYGKLQQDIIPLDEYLPAKYGQHPRQDIARIFEGNVRALATKETYIGQTSNANTSTVGHPTSTHTNITLPPVENNTQLDNFLNVSDWKAWTAKYINPAIRNKEYNLIVDEIGDTNILEFPLFTEEFCKEVVALSERANKWTENRHQNYPTNDVLVGELGLDAIYSRVLREFVYPLAIHWWTLEGRGWDDLRDETFIARYTLDKQPHLSLHHDASVMTMVLKLNDDFTGGGTWFPKYRVLSNPSKVGVATLHPGQVTHLHGARPIDSGRRYVAVSFLNKR